MNRCMVTVGVIVSMWTVLPIAAAQEWTRFRGPNGSGVSDATTIPVKWTDADYNWKIELPGEGISAPVLWGEKLFVTSADAAAGKRWLLCINADDGKTLWSREFTFNSYKKHGNNTYATSTPAADAERVYALWQSKEASELVALDHAGRDVWRFDLGPFQGGHGGGISPIVHEDLVILQNDQEGPSYLVALDAASGKVRWKLDRTTDRASYATPCVYERPGRPAEIIFTEWKQGITAVDAKTGKQTWQIEVFGDETERAISSPIVAGDLVIGTCGFVTAKKHTVAVRPEDTAAGVEVKEVFRFERQVAYLPSSLVYNGLLFCWSEQGIVTCLSATTGEQIWQQRVGGKYSSSPVCAGGKLYNIDEDGTLIVLAAADEFEELARNDLGEGSRSTPAIANGRIYLRTFSKLMSLGGK
jgi:outer membrane protein assembly factor BamB